MSENYRVFKATIEVISGLHIGGDKDSVDIGGVDNPVIKDNKGWPYIPGSSLKGKLRSLLEQKYLGGEINPSQYSLEVEDKIDKKVLKLTKEELKSFITIASLFGSPDISSALIFRDLVLKKDDQNPFPMDYIESKFENVVDRKTGKVNEAGVRETERVIPGTKFEGEIIVNVKLFNRNIEYLVSRLEQLKEKFENLKDSEKIESLRVTFDEAFEYLKGAISILNEYDYLGGNGSRGYGRVKLAIDKN
jgi:CRISPR-associated protein Csm3